MNLEEEMQKCKEDPVYFYENYFIINGEKPPLLTEDKKRMLRAFVKGHSIIFNSRSGYKILFKKVLTADLPSFITQQKLLK